jgi:hypothetical protein
MPVPQFTAYVPTTLLLTSLSPTGSAEVVTGMQIGTGLTQGSRFYLTESQANAASLTGGQTFHRGWYRWVKIDAGATIANIQAGAIGAPVTLAGGIDTLTDYSHILNAGFGPAVFLGPIPAGSYAFVQDAGDASLLIGAGQTVSVGSVLVSATGGFVNVAGSITDTVYSTIVGIATAALTVPAAASGTAVAAASGGVAVYTVTLTGGASNGLVGQYAVVTAAANAVNNGTFLITASTATTITLANPAAIAETHSSTVTPQGLVRSWLGVPFGQNT